VKAVNRWGFSQWFSDPTVILAATVPDRTYGVEASIDALTGALSVSWDLPRDRGTIIIDYLVEIEAKSGTFTKISTSSGPGLSCLTSMSVIRSAPISL